MPDAFARASCNSAVLPTPASPRSTSARAARASCSVQQRAQLGTLRLTPTQHDMILCAIGLP